MSIPKLQNFFDKRLSFSDMDYEILDAFKTCVNFSKLHPEIIFTRVDKGNVTIALNKYDYNQKMVF